MPPPDPATVATDPRQGDFRTLLADARSAVVNGTAQALRAVVLPFVFRRYLDYNVFESLRTLHQQIRDHAAKRSAGHPERANDVKLSRGGIREIEFTEIGRAHV